MIVKNEIVKLFENAIEEAAREGRIPDGQRPQVKIEYPKEERFGDYSSPFALEAARVFRRSPLEIGGIIASYMERSDMVERAEVAKPGFVNLFLSPEYLYRIMNAIVEERDSYGRNSKGSPRRVNIEFVSANPTGPLNIVSARAAAIGDTLAKLLEASGDEVDREFYVNDYGNQVEPLGLSVLCRYRELLGQSVEFPENGYHGEYVKDIALYIKERFGSEIENIRGEDALIDFMAKKAIEYNLD